MFRSIITLFFLALFTAPLSAQTTVEKSMTGLQFNLNNLAVYHEIGLSDIFTLRAQAGLTLALEGRGNGDNIDLDLYLTPVVRLEPRLYYNLAKREYKGKRTANNSGNFFGLKTEYQLPYHLVRTDNRRKLRGHVKFIPRWGIRRNLGSNWDFELGLGLGRRVVIYSRGNDTITEVDVVPDVEWKFGFRF